MYKARSAKEVYVSLPKLAKALGLNRAVVHHWVVKSKLRTYNIQGARHIEARDAMGLIDFLADRFDIDESVISDVKSVIRFLR